MAHSSDSNDRFQLGRPGSPPAPGWFLPVALFVVAATAAAGYLGAPLAGLPPEVGAAIGAPLGFVYTGAAEWVFRFLKPRRRRHDDP
jgi:hypothetical protein